MTLRWSQIKPFLIFLIPLALLPLPVNDNDPANIYAYGLLVTGSFWLLELLPIGLTSLLPMIIFPFAGLMKPKELAKCYFPDMSMLFLSTMMLACAVERTGLHRRIALCTLKICGTSLKSLMFGLMLATWFLSMWISNAAATALMMPVVEAIIGLFKISLNSEIEKDKFLEDNKEEIEAADQTVKIPSVLSKGLSLAIMTAANLGGLVTLSGTSANLVGVNILQEMFPCYTPKISFSMWSFLGLPTSILLLIVMYLYHVLYWLVLARKDEKEANQKLSGDMIDNVINQQYQQLKKIQFNELYAIFTLILMVIFWFFKSPHFIKGWADFYPDQSKRPSDSTIGLFFAILLFVVPNKIDLKKFQDTDWKDTILTWDVFQSYCPWGIIFLIGAAVALSQGAIESGFNDRMGERVNEFGNLSESTILWICLIVIALFTEICSNTATSNLVLPIINSLAANNSINPLYLSLPVNMAASLAFMLPVATGPNCIVFSYKRIKVFDMIKCGVMLNMIGVVVIALMGQVYFPILLDSKNYDQNWINGTAVC